MIIFIADILNLDYEFRIVSFYPIDNIISKCLQSDLIPYKQEASENLIPLNVQLSNSILWELRRVSSSMWIISCPYFWKAESPQIYSLTWLARSNSLKQKIALFYLSQVFEKNLKFLTLFNFISGYLAKYLNPLYSNSYPSWLLENLTNNKL